MTQFIANQWLEGQGEAFQSIAPFENTPIWDGQYATPDQVNHAVTAAANAFPDWADLTLEQRLEYVLKYKAELEKNFEKISQIIAQETGKPLWEATMEADRMVAKVQLALDAHKERLAELTLAVGDAQGITRYKPHGPCAVLGPFNLPGHLPNGHIIPALLAGNTIVFKPSEKTPLIGEEMIRCWHNAGLPAGVVNLVHGAAEIGKALITHPDIVGVFFTGSYNVGRAINQLLADHPEKIVALEMGGNNPLIVHESADTKAAIYHTLLSAYITTGQRCTCARRLIVPQTAQGDQFIDQLAQHLPKMNIGAWNADPAPFFGPLIDIEAAQNMLKAQDQYIADGATPLVTMQQHEASPALLTPGLIDLTPLKTITDTEHFGPLLKVIRVPDFDAAIDAANATAYGLSAALLSDNPDNYKRFYRKIRAGIVNWNRQTTGASGRFPFGGCGKSGNNRPAGFFSADYCAFPVASLEANSISIPEKTIVGTGF
ncbi:N-succinylglutamate 5-semialdehyde dehydrogenase [Poriferisphaera corsica]|uniref:N-succinylglutamate 5-semialdehyde dehydrogenase n=1 Tax=Poriferisphaera corsica TaxID=2528020 RepID=A0A517YXV7_9BACT|nr:succinylglutamate-semialdehyde dehydrogenase [Poriferisphaera corsica]QDU35039.1 N-succinylglutamate 5-semialdehyde dehydrogenase [Poriferisphaera corsica]